MTGVIVANNMAAVPWTHSSLGSDEVDRLRSTSTTWRRDSSERNRTNSDAVIVNGIRTGNDETEDGRSAMGDSETRNENDVDNHIVSVHNNPFFKTYGIRTQRPDFRSGEDAGGRESLVTLRSASMKDSDNVFDDDEPQEYRPGSGFVHKLMGKFSSLTTREENTFRPKRTASLENLLDDHSKRDSSIKDDVPRKLSSTNLSKSVENVNNVGKHLRPLKVPTTSYRSSAGSGSDYSDRRSSSKSPREGMETPFLPRDDIIIIEREPTEKPELKPHSPEIHGKFTGTQAYIVKDESADDELPKKNTVLSVRSMFEKSGPSSAPIPIYSTATGPILSPTSTLKNPPFSQKAVSKVQPSVVSDSPQSTPREEPIVKSTKRMAPKPPVQPEQKTTLPVVRPRTKQNMTPVIAVAPFVNESSTNEQDIDIKSDKKNDSGGIWPEDSVAKVFDSSAIIKPPVDDTPVAPVRRNRASAKQQQYSNSVSNQSRNESITNSRNESNTKKELDNQKKEFEKKVMDTKPLTNGSSANSVSNFNSNSESSKPVSNYSNKSLNTVEPTVSTSNSNRRQEASRADTIRTSLPSDRKLEQLFPNEVPVTDLDTHIEQQNVNEIEMLPEGDSGPQKGIPRVIAERLKNKNGNKAGQNQSSVVNNTSSQEDISMQSAFAKFEGDKFGKKRKIKPEEPRDTTNETIIDFRKNLKSVSDAKSSKVSQVFDTSQIVRTPVNHNIPKLDLSGLNEDQRNGYYQEGYINKKIQPCTIVFIGAEVRLGRNMLDKNRTAKGKIQFNDNENQTFEYPTEEVLLEEYLALHPNEPTEILILEDVIATESSDDADSEPPTPRNGSSSDTDETLKSNTSLSHSGGLSNYRAKFQMDYTFGAEMEEPIVTKPTSPPQQEEEDSQIVPADNDITWSEETNSDLLF